MRTLGCPNPAVLSDFAAGILPTGAARMIESHIMGCGKCAEQLAELPIADDLLARLRELERDRTDEREVRSRIRDVRTRLSDKA